MPEAFGYFLKFIGFTESGAAQNPQYQEIARYHWAKTVSWLNG
jgi:hypothetical protein